MVDENEFAFLVALWLQIQAEEVLFLCEAGVAAHGFSAIHPPFTQQPSRTTQLQITLWLPSSFPFAHFLPAHCHPTAIHQPFVHCLPADCPLFACGSSAAHSCLDTHCQCTCSHQHLGTLTRAWESRAKGPGGLLPPLLPSRGMVTLVWGHRPWVGDIILEYLQVWLHLMFSCWGC